MVLIEDVTKHVKEHVTKLWQEEWNEQIRNGNKLGNIKRTCKKWTNFDTYKRKDQTVLTRLRIGHTNLTHIHLIEKTSPPICTCTIPLTVRHIFECTNNYKTVTKHLN